MWPQDFMRSKASLHERTPHTYSTPTDYTRSLQPFPLQELGILKLFFYNPHLGNLGNLSNSQMSELKSSSGRL